MEYTFTVTGFNCGACVKVSQMVLKKIEGIESVEIQESGLTKIVSTKALDMDQVRSVLKEKGYGINIAL